MRIRVDAFIQSQRSRVEQGAGVPIWLGHIPYDARAHLTPARNIAKEPGTRARVVRVRVDVRT